MPIGRTVNIVGRSIHFWWQAAWDRGSSTTNPDFWTGSGWGAPGPPLRFDLYRSIHPGGHSQFSVTLEAQTRESRPLGDLLAWISDHLRHDLSVNSLARRAAMSARNSARLFKQELGKTPAKHIEDLRLEAARRQLESSALSAWMKSRMRAG
jgi:Helix-turn-helix domain